MNSSPSMDEEQSDYRPRAPYFQVNLELVDEAFVECHIYRNSSTLIINRRRSKDRPDLPSGKYWRFRQTARRLQASFLTRTLCSSFGKCSGHISSSCIWTDGFVIIGRCRSSGGAWVVGWGVYVVVAIRFAETGVHRSNRIKVISYSVWDVTGYAFVSNYLVLSVFIDGPRWGGTAGGRSSDDSRGLPRSRSGLIFPWRFGKVAVVTSAIVSMLRSRYWSSGGDGGRGGKPSISCKLIFISISRE